MKPKPNDTQQFEATWLFPHVKEVVRPDEVALATTMSVDQVIDHCEAGHFLDVAIGDKPVDKQVRKHRRIQRFSVEAWWLNRMEDQGIKMPVRETPQITWWCAELRKKKGALK